MNLSVWFDSYTDGSDLLQRFKIRRKLAFTNANLLRCQMRNCSRPIVSLHSHRISFIGTGTRPKYVTLSANVTELASEITTSRNWRCCCKHHQNIHQNDTTTLDRNFSQGRPSASYLSRKRLNVFKISVHINTRTCTYITNWSLRIGLKFELISVDMTKVLVCTMNSPTHLKSYVFKLYGDPDDYAYKFGNDTFDDKLPILVNSIRFNGFDFLHSMSIDYHWQRIYFGNNLHRRLEFAHFIYNNESHTWYFDFLPESSQVILTKSIQVRKYSDLEVVAVGLLLLLLQLQSFYSSSGICPGLLGWAGTRKVKPVWIYWRKR